MPMNGVNAYSIVLVFNRCYKQCNGLIDFYKTLGKCYGMFSPPSRTLTAHFNLVFISICFSNWWNSHMLSLLHYRARSSLFIELYI